MVFLWTLPPDRQDFTPVFASLAPAPRPNLPLQCWQYLFHHWGLRTQVPAAGARAWIPKPVSAAAGAGSLRAALLGSGSSVQFPDLPAIYAPRLLLFKAA